MKNELLQQRDCLKYWEKYGRHTLPSPLPWGAVPRRFPRSSILLTTERLSAKRFSYCWAKAVSNNHAFLQLAQSPPWDFGTLGVKSAWSTNTLILWGEEKKGSVCLQLAPALGSPNKPGFVKMAAGMTFSPQTFLFVSGRGTHGKVHQEIKAVKVVFLTQQLRVYVLLCTVSLSSPDAAFPSPEGPSLPGGVSGALLNSDERQHVFCILPSTVSPFRCWPWGEHSLHQGFMGA